VVIDLEPIIQVRSKEEITLTLSLFRRERGRDFILSRGEKGCEFIFSWRMGGIYGKNLVLDSKNLVLDGKNLVLDSKNLVVDGKNLVLRKQFTLDTIALSPIL
jgi:hypothetical protein